MSPGCDSLLRVLRATQGYRAGIVPCERLAVADRVGIVPRERLVGPRAIRKKMGWGHCEIRKKARPRPHEPFARDSQASLATLARQITP
ncbi:hypothetical protein PRIPAC_80356, partial [Pristionchus pacificus]|uniref:Uncharacterized protein n=1 Tax=Pristionchus pacificus TaxID=54126 RepID=A0A2A6CLD6_PRIPA